MSLDHQRETQFNREGQLREQQLKNELRKLQSFMNRDPFVSVLIDGDGMIFEDEMIRRGEMGGKEAATRLWNEIKDYVHEKLPDIPSDCRTVTRIYANLKGLADVCYKAGTVERSSTVEDFYRGFTGSKILFDFIDVGPGKDRADEKITELFKLHLSDYHCHHIFFGCSHDNGYARLLEQYTEPTLTTRITLLEGVPFEKELKFLQSQYSTVKFDGLFRPQKINIHSQPQYSVPQPAPNRLVEASPDNVGVPLSQNFYQSPFPPITSASNPSPAPSNPSIPNPRATSWATTATAAAHFVSPPATPTPTVSHPITSEEIPRNRYGQRIDPPIVYDKEVVNKVRNLKLCNVYFLRRDCQYDPCTHSHKYKITKNELAALKTIARMVPCYYGSDCDDPKCIYGHR
ncbi:MAG: hypothetical protein LQ338_002615 [Usnochroma carphineum]|nr:MAG: hypothetical protein LQ338_002615 [Usnochroma carphineum]